MPKRHQLEDKPKENIEKKEPKEIIKKVGIQSIIWIIIITFVLGISTGFRGNHSYQVLKVGNRSYTVTPNSLFDMLFQQVYANPDPSLTLEEINLQRTLAKKYALEQLSFLATINAFSKSQGVISSRKALSDFITYQNHGQEPSQSLLDFVTHNYSYDQMFGNMGQFTALLANDSDILKSPLVSSFKNLENWKASSDVFYLSPVDVLDDLSSKDKIENFYNENKAEFVDKYYVTDISIQSKQKSNAILATLKENEDLSSLPEEALINEKVAITKDKATEKRFTSLENIALDSWVDVPVFENKAYHILKLTSYTSLKDQTKDIKDKVDMSFYTENKENLDLAFSRKQQDYEKDLSLFHKVSLKPFSSIDTFFALTSGKNLPFNLLSNSNSLDIIWGKKDSSLFLPIDGYLVKIDNIKHITTKETIDNRKINDFLIQDWYKNLKDLLNLKVEEEVLDLI